MFTKYTTRLFHVYRPVYASDKSLLASLRKKTGYTFANCKKALEMNNNDPVKAEHWLKEQAQAMGWTKATKLEGRTTKQGLVALAVEKNKAAIVEVNCETDFVARNDNFQNMVSNTVKTCLKYCDTHHTTNSLTKIGFDAEQLKQLKSINGKSLADELALMIGNVGENASMRRAFCMQSNGDIYISGYIHPSGKALDNVLLGRFGALVALRKTSDKPGNMTEVAKNICQHIVGMNPRKIGSEEDKPAENADDEECLIHQEYVNDNTLSVKEVLDENGIEVVDFKRFECGEVLDCGDFGQPVDPNNICQ